MTERPPSPCIKVCVLVDGSRCAQFEQTIVITDDGADVLTVAKALSVYHRHLRSTAASHFAGASLETAASARLRDEYTAILRKIRGVRS
jgi:hypothetical protein